jgi:hypothetical protein
MSTPFTKDDLGFLVAAMEKKAKLAQTKMRPRASLALRDAAPAAQDRVKGDMSIPKPIEVNVQGTMTASDYKACSTVMSICQNMVQKTITEAAKKNGVDATVALKNMTAWVKAYTDFPFPFFNFKDTQSDVYKRADWMLSADPTVVESIVNIKGLNGLKDAVVGALKTAGGNLASYQGTDRAFNYFGVVTGYNDTEISTRVVKFQMHLKTTNVDSLCVHYAKTNLDTEYDTYQFVADKELMIKMQSKIEGKMIEYMADKLLEFVEAFYDRELEEYQKDIGVIVKGG